MFTYGTERAKEIGKENVFDYSLGKSVCAGSGKIYKENDRIAGDGKPGSPSWIQPEPRYRQCA